MRLSQFRKETGVYATECDLRLSKFVTVCDWMWLGTELDCDCIQLNVIWDWVKVNYSD